MYEIVTKYGYRTCALTEDTAKEMADFIHQKWADMGIEVPVEVFYLGHLIYTTQGNPATP